MGEELSPVKDISPAHDRLVLQAHFPHFTPELLYDYWTKKRFLKLWWPQEIPDFSARLGGSYHFAWPEQDWHLRGQYTTTERGHKLAFTWKWDHEPDGSTRQVRIDFRPSADGGTEITLTQGPYSERDQQTRKSHRDGWTYFLSKLRALDLAD